MPSVQRGQLYRRNGAWGFRYYDEAGLRRRRGGFKTKEDAGDVLDDLLRRQKLGHLARERDVTVSEAVDRYLAQHDVDQATIAKLRQQLKQATDTFGELKLRELEAPELGAWRKTLSEGSRHDVFRALKQVLEQATRWKWIEESPARHVKNPRPRRPEIIPLGSWADVDKIAGELNARFAAIPLFAVGTGLRPEELFALERRDVDRVAGVVHVRRVYSQGVEKTPKKNSLQLRRVPLRQRVLDALEAMPPRLDTPLLFPAAEGGYIDLQNWRSRHWDPAVKAAGLATCTCGHSSGEHAEDGCDAARCRCEAFKRARGSPRPYDMRHTYATFSIAAGVDLFTLSRRMGTSLAMIDQTYGHLAPHADERERAQLDAWDAGETEREGVTKRRL